MADFPDKLEIPVSTSVSNFRWMTVQLKSDGDGKYVKPKQEDWAPNYLYRLTSNGREYSLFASARLREKIMEAGATTGTTLNLGRLGEGTSTNWEVQYVAGPQKDWGAVNQQQAAPAQNNGRAQPQTISTNHEEQRVYHPLENLELIEALTRDRLTIWTIVFGQVRNNFPDEDTEWQRQLATHIAINLDYDLLAIKKGESPSVMAASNWIVEEIEPLPDPNLTEGKIIIVESAYESAPTKGEKIKVFFEKVAEQHEAIDSVHHVKGIAKKLGYASVPGDPEARLSMIKEIWFYEDARQSGLDANDSLRLVNQKLGRPLELMALADDEPDDDLAF